MDKEIVSTEQRIKLIEEKLDKLLEDKKLGFTLKDSEIDEIFSISAQELSKLPSQKLSEYSFIIARYGLFLQKELNKQRGLLNWAKKCIDYIVLPRMKEYRQGYMTSEEPKMMAIKDNDVANKLWVFALDKEHEVTIISELSFDIRRMSDSLNELFKSKRYNNV